jgi:hypothetical protein
MADDPSLLEESPAPGADVSLSLQPPGATAAAGETALGGDNAEGVQSAVAFLIQASTDLSNWTPISNVSLANGTTVQFADPGAVTFKSRFYRAVSP